MALTGLGLPITTFRHVAARLLSRTTPSAGNTPMTPVVVRPAAITLGLGTYRVTLGPAPAVRAVPRVEAIPGANTRTSRVVRPVAALLAIVVRRAAIVNVGARVPLNIATLVGATCPVANAVRLVAPNLPTVLVTCPSAKRPTGTRLARGLGEAVGQATPTAMPLVPPLLVAAIPFPRPLLVASRPRLAGKEVDGLRAAIVVPPPRPVVLAPALLLSGIGAGVLGPSSVPFRPEGPEVRLVSATH